jgi:flagellar M-ring protein FliF
VVFLVTWFGLKPMVRAITNPASTEPALPTFEELRALQPPDPAIAAITADPGGFAGGGFAGGGFGGDFGMPGNNALEELRQKIKPAPQERLARMVDLNEERSAHILRKWASGEADEAEAA